MSNIYKNVIELIGKTPLVEVENVEKRFKLQARLLVKLDGYNPCLLYTSDAADEL